MALSDRTVTVTRPAATRVSTANGRSATASWAAFRIVQLPSFADFLISVEGEMNKVSWPSRGELFRASLVVMVVIFFLSALLFAYDVVLEAARVYLDRLVGWLFA